MKQLILTLMAALLLGVPASARSLQQALQLVPAAKKVTIEDGHIYLNGKRVDDAGLPEACGPSIRI